MDFVTVCHKNDLPQMIIQSRSMEKYLKNFPVDQIIIIINDINFQTCLDYINLNVLHNYGYLKDKIQIVNASNIMRLTHGYLDQQRLKIKISDFIKTDVYCILDAKDYFITNWTLDKIQNNGRYITTINTVKNPDSSVINSFKHFGLDAFNEKRLFNRTPYFSHTEITKTLCNTDEIFDKWKVKHLEEFSLMQAAMIYSGIQLEDFYYHIMNWRSGIWEEFLQYHLNPDNYISNLMKASDKLNLCSSIHRRVFSKLPKEILDQQIKMWTSLNLLTYDESNSLIKEMKELNPWIS